MNKKYVDFLVDQMRSLNQRARTLISDADKVFFDADVMCSPQVQTQVQLQQQEFYNTLMELVSKIQLQKMDGVNTKQNNYPTFPINQLSISNIFNENVNQQVKVPRNLAFEIIFNNKTIDNTAEQLIFTVDKNTNQHIEISQADLNKVNVPASFDTLLQQIQVQNTIQNINQQIKDLNIATVFTNPLDNLPPGLENYDTESSIEHNVARAVTPKNVFSNQKCTSQERESQNKSVIYSPFSQRQIVNDSLNSQRSHRDDSNQDNYDCSDDQQQFHDTYSKIEQTYQELSQSEPPLANVTTEHWLPLQQRVNQQQQKKQQIEQIKLQQIKQKNEKIYSQSQKAQIIKQEKVQNQIQKQIEQNRKAEENRKYIQQQRQQVVHRNVQKIEDNKRKKQLERIELLNRINKNWDANEKRRRVYRKTEQQKRQIDVEMQQILWNGFEQLLKPNFIDDLNLLSKKVEVAEIIQLAKEMQYQEMLNKILQELLKNEDNNIVNTKLNAKQDFKLNDVECLLYAVIYTMLMMNQQLNQQNDIKQQSYEHQIVFPQVANSDIYQIPGILHESMLLFTLYYLFKKYFELYEKEYGNQNTVIQFSQNTQFNVCQSTNTDKNYLKFKSNQLDYIVEQYNKHHNHCTCFEQSNNSNNLFNSQLINVLINTLIDKIEFPILVNERFLKEIVKNQSKENYLYDLLSSNQFGLQIINLFINSGLYQFNQQSAQRLFQLLVNQAAQLVLSPHTFIDDNIVQEKVIVTNKIMFQEFSTMLQIIIQLINSILMKDQILFTFESDIYAEISEPAEIQKIISLSNFDDSMHNCLQSNSQNNTNEISELNTPKSHFESNQLRPLTKTRSNNIILIKELQWILNIILSPKIYYFPHQSLFNNKSVPYYVFLPRTDQLCTLQLLNNGYKTRAMNQNKIFQNTTTLNYKFNVCETIFKEFIQYEDSIVNSGLYHALIFTRLLYQNQLFDQTYMKEYFQQILRELPVECYMSKQFCLLLSQVARTFQVSENEQWIGVV